MVVDRALYDTSALIAGSRITSELAVSVMSLAELRIGILRAREAAVGAFRLERLRRIEAAARAFPVDHAVAREYARLASILREHGHVVRPVDTIIAATAISNGLPVVTLDEDFRPFAELGGLHLVEV